MKKWSRRKLLAAAGTGIGSAALANTFGSSLWAAEQVKACTLTPELEVGPFYYPYELVRQDIRENKAGLALRFALDLRHARTCAPIANAAVDVWHCNAMGLYSAFTKTSLGPPPGGFGGPGGPPPADPSQRPRMDMGPNGPPPGGPGGPEGRNGPPQMKPTDEETFLRGIQITDARGSVEFDTIFPGWYQGRDTHIHMEVHIDGHSTGTAHAHDAAHTEYPKYGGGHVCHIGQICFDDELSDLVAKTEPYRQHQLRRTRLKEDHVFMGEPRDYLMQIKRNNAASLQAGLTGTITVFVDPDSTPAPVGMGPGGPGGPGEPRPADQH